MLNATSILKESDFAVEEKELIQLHIDNCNTISWETMESAWRDDEGNLCVRYAPVLDYESQWYRYNATQKEWW